MRFPEFSGEWKKVNVSKLLDFYSTNSLSWEQLDYNNGKIKNLHYGLIHKGLSTMIDVFSASLPYIKEGTIPKSYTLFKEGDVAFADASEDTNDVAKAIEVINCDGQQIVSGLHTIHGRDNSNQTVIGYKGYAFASDSFHKQIRRIAQGTKVFSISIRNFDEVYIGVPSKDEQTKIAKLLIAIDERIATQNKIIEKLQSLIKGLRVCCMQRVYGNNVYLSEIAQIYQPQTISSTELTEDGFLVYGANGIIGKYKDYNHETEQICITCRGNTCGMVNYTKPMSWITGNAMVINTDKYQDKVCKRYLYHYLSAYNFNSIISGSGQPQIVRTPLEKLKITLPTISEQKQKAIIFDKIQDKIDINHKVLNLYIGQKQYLLRQMFI
ncbi:restriction endonuclease subunit S [Parabacteroides distasonis]|uniref:restriction endonuclease subunit S n=1 Tax=Bacteroidales TaxID=171549 RepID=UPI002163E4FE|nr:MULTISPECIES: restriction endonuclease subunit S [Bacteroidales]UVQ77864.1 restriction endonuclease subunit S [Parabacteroides distasonis]